jgi:tetratricopeptide (TPR) repeat protein
MSEVLEGREEGAPTSAVGVDPAAIAVALGGASREKADAFLDDQRKLIEEQSLLTKRQAHLVDLQAKELAHELKLRHWSLQLRHASAILKFALEVSLALVGVAIAGLLGAVLWNAAHSDGLIIESFSVPPDMAARGITGQVVASQMLDQLTAMQNVTTAVRPARSYVNNWGDDIKVEIPDTGMSVSEAYRFLRGWLGHETHISGEVTRTATGIAITARSGGDPGATVTGTEDDFRGLVQMMAEQIYSVTQPYRYAIYLENYASNLGRPLRVSEGIALIRKLTESPDPIERAYAWNGLSVASRARLSDLQAARLDSQNAIAAAPNLSIAFGGLAIAEFDLGHAETALSVSQTIVKRIASGSVSGTDSAFGLSQRIHGPERGALLLGDYARAESLERSAWNVTEGMARVREDFRNGVPVALARRHDSAARTVFRQLPPPPLPIDRGPRSAAGLLTEAALENWQAVIAQEPAVEETYVRFSSGWDTKTIFARQLRPLVALAKAKLGDYAVAQQLVTQAPVDCYDCVRVRGMIAALAGQPARTDYWFAHAVHDAPSIPFAYHDWGRALLDRGKPDEAIGKFQLANQKGPHFADPLEGWGEALMAKNQSHLALAKFAEADKYAPNWGRLHLKWGEALVYAGRGDEAKAQFARAATLDLTPSEKAELAGVARIKKQEVE